MSSNSPVVEGFRRDLVGGVPVETVADYARRHLDALIALPAHTEGRDEEIRATSDFLADPDVQRAIRSSGD